jgi:NADH:ubiquinone oxidoreductase subunit
MVFGMRLYSLLFGKLVGKDDFGNSYYEGRRACRGYGRTNRWVLYKGQAEASKVPPEWYNWLHRQIEKAPDPKAKRYKWQKPHVPNLTGTKYAYYPPGHALGKGRREKATGDYEPWNPEN